MNEQEQNLIDRYLANLEDPDEDEELDDDEKCWLINILIGALSDLEVKFMEWKEKE